ncbi:hypothetical protein LO772_11625 [Yinghuangia sp. ASG 101]|uniref:hypothetical protein n=1 Tax=Yinghuangia sp. ASG 101 TaxID=2896848 RepID=UPI001E450737|nr:hypothetical protein [Yinghuangia sp. ASG 101]UGQ14182.1 hypothetical protein LO772_11625 [Yinghuangia sp. ASG 101]
MAKKKAPKSKAAKILGLGMQVFGAIGVMKQIKEARGKNDKLELTDAIVSAAAVVTGVALLIRSFREEEEEAVEAGL